MKEKKLLNAVQFSKQMEVDYSTVMRWLKNGLVPGAELVDTLIGQVWQIPEGALQMERPKAGRKPTKRQSRQGNDPTKK